MKGILQLFLNRISRFLAITLSLGALSAACAPFDVNGGSKPNDEETLVTSPVSWPEQSKKSEERHYLIAVGDKLNIKVPGDEALSGIVPVGEDGIISHPRIGKISTLDLSLKALEQIIRERLTEAGSTNVSVTIEVLNLRSIYVIGEVVNSGEYPYVGGLNIAEAIDQAGGYTYRADENRVFLTGLDQGTEKEVTRSDRFEILPGDIIRVPQRYF